jgi:hypothetical protein
MDWLKKLFTKDINPTGSWTPKLGEFYHHYDFERGRLCTTMCDPETDTFKIRVATGNCFRTEKEITPKVLKKVLKNLIKHYKLQIK